MAIRKRTTLEDWLTETLNDETKKDKDGKPRRCNAVALVHYSEKRETELATCQYGASNFNPKDLANLFNRRAETYAQDLSGVQTFELLAFFEGRTEPEGHQPFRKSGVESELGSSLSTEAPTAVGSMAAMMRHNEAMVGMGYRQTMAASEFMLGIMDRMERRLERTEHERDEATTLVRTLTYEILDRRNAGEERLIDKRNNAEMIKAALKNIPIILNSIAGYAIMPQDSEDAAIIEMLAEKVSVEDMGAIMQKLPPEAMGVVYSRMTRYQKEKADRMALEKTQGNHVDSELGFSKGTVAEMRGEVVNGKAS